MNVDLAIRGGTVVLEDNVEVTDIGIKGGTIAAVGPDVGRATRDIDARELIVLPGGVDPHVHLRVGASSSELPFADDFASGSRAAAAGGLTTIGVMTSVGSDDSPDRAIKAAVQEATSTSLIDFVLHPEIENPSADALEGLRDLWREGFPSVKIYMMLGDFQSRLGGYARIIREAAHYGVVVMIHCEWGPLLQAFQSHLIANREGRVNNYPRSRPTCVELTATEWAVALGRATGARIYVVHLSSAVALAACKRARTDGVAIYVETRPLYLYFDDSVFTRSDAGLFVGNPPIRTGYDRRALWSGLLNNEIDTVGSDHVSHGRVEKVAPDIDVTSAVPGSVVFNSFSTFTLPAMSMKKSMITKTTSIIGAIWKPTLPSPELDSSRTAMAYSLSFLATSADALRTAR